MANKLKVTPVKYAIHKEGSSPIFGKDTITVTADDEGAGFYYVIHQVNPTLLNKENFGEGRMTLEKEEVEAILEVIKELEKHEA